MIDHCTASRCVPGEFVAIAGNKFVEDPYTKARFHPQCSGQLSPVGDIAQIGADVSGLLCSPTQLR